MFGIKMSPPWLRGVGINIYEPDSGYNWGVYTSICNSRGLATTHSLPVHTTHTKTDATIIVTLLQGLRRRKKEKKTCFKKVESGFEVVE